jgi:glycosyltransferase involved in cell wall biosynthesis
VENRDFFIGVSDKKVSAIIPSYNRYRSVMGAISSVKNQTHQNIEVVVVNDKSSDPRYYAGRPEGVVWIDLPRNSKDIFGFPCPGYVRNKGLEIATGEYIAFLDNDDFWLPDKIHSQLLAMHARGYPFSCTEGLTGERPFIALASYPIYHREYFSNFCKQFFEKYRGNWNGSLPEVFDNELIQQHNFIITSSVVVEKRLLQQAGNFNLLPVGEEDKDLWIRCLRIVNCLHLNNPLVYYDGRLSQKKGISMLYRRIFRNLKRLFSRE